MGKRIERKRATASYRWPWEIASVAKYAQTDLVGFVHEAFKRHGDQVRFVIGPRDIYRTKSAEDAQRILVDDAKSYVKPSSGLGVDPVKTLLGGGGLLMLNGDQWRRHRRMIQPSLMRSRIGGYADIIRDVAREYFARLSPRGTPINIKEVYNELTLELVCRLLFDVSVKDEYGEIQALLTDMGDKMVKAATSPAWAPTPANLKYKAAIKRVDGFIYRLIDERLALGPEALLSKTDVLSTLVASVDEDARAPDQHKFTRQELRNEIITLFLAGHDTTSLALTWATMEVGRNKHVDDALAAERAAGDARPYKSATLSETLRLYPSAFAFMRENIAPVTLGPFELEPGANIAVWSIFIHRDERYWSRPESFEPERFMTDEKPAPGTYIPFGGGTRVCIGKHFALMEAGIILEELLNRFVVDSTGAGPAVFATNMTLTPKYGMPVTLRLR